MAKYEIQYDRDGCIGAGACANVDPSNWRMASDGKADLLKKDIDEAELEASINAARACPVNVIHIVNKETGEKLV
jgi:ferredoxin